MCSSQIVGPSLRANGSRRSGRTDVRLSEAIKYRLKIVDCLSLFGLLAMTVLDRPNQHPYCVTWAVLTACSNIAISALVISVGEFAV